MNFKKLKKTRKLSDEKNAIKDMVSDEAIEYSTIPTPITSEEELEVLNYMSKFDGAAPSDLYF